MKKGNKLHGLATKILGLALAFCMAVSFCAPLHVEAKKIKTLKLKRLTNLSATFENADSMATTAKKGTYKIKISKGRSSMCEAYIKFVAPKTKTYTFTLSDLKNNKNTYILGSATFHSHDPKSSFLTNRHDVNVTGTNDSVLRVHSKKKTESAWAYKKTGKIQLNEGEVLYIHFLFTSSRPGKYVTAKLKIK